MKSIYVVALFACIAGAFGQMNAGLTVSAVATWTPIPEITIESSGFECASEVIIDNEVTDMPDLGFSFPYKLYPPSSVNFGSSCSASDADSASIVVVDSENVGSVPGLVSSLEVVLEDGTVGPILSLVLGFPKSATWYFNQATTCSSGFESSANSTGSTPTDPLSNPVGVVFSAQSDMPVINGFEFVPGLRYFHYVIMDSSGAVGAFCSYSRFTGETPSPTSVPPSGTETPIMTGTETEMPTGTGMETGTETEMPTGTGMETGTETEMPTGTGMETATPTTMETATPTTMETVTPTTMETATPTMTPTLDPSTSESISASISESVSESVSESISASESASESPTATPTEEPICFPGDVSVELADGSLKTMRELQVGDSIRVGVSAYSDVYFFGHKDRSGSAEFITIEGQNSVSISISRLHYLYVNGGLVSAEEVKEGDLLELSTGEKMAVTQVRKEMKIGVFAPHTLDGDIIVNGVRASTYTRVVHPEFAHLLLAPLRFLYRLGLPALTFLEKTSQAGLARALRLPSGPAAL